MKITGLKNNFMTTGSWCSHFENGRTAIPRICIRDYACRQCPFYYWLEDFGEVPACDKYSEGNFSQVQAA
jgi:hypothetical protein